MPCLDDLPAPSFLVPGETVWRVAEAERLAFIVDAEDFFRLAKQAMLAARHSVFLIGWDFDARIELSLLALGRDENEPSLFERLTDDDYDRIRRTQDAIKEERARRYQPFLEALSA